jgi:hypothetical protein
LEDDEEAVDDGPENASNLVGHCAVPVVDVSKSSYVGHSNWLNIIAIDQVLGCDIAALLGSIKRINSFDVFDHDKDAAGKDQDERDYAQEADNIKSKENIWDESQLDRRQDENKVYLQALVPIIMIEKWVLRS